MNIFEIEVHPAADIFPMIPKDELNELAEDIKANGLIHPIVVKDGILIDGRNRRAACEIAGVEPEIEELNGEDIGAYIISSNVMHRRLTKGQSAMAVAMVHRVAYERKAGKFPTLDASQLGKARLILNHSETLAKEVMAGTKTFDAALKQAKREKAEADERAERMQFLSDNFPDLVSLINEETLTLDDAWAVRESRDHEEIAKVDGFNRDIKGLLFEAACLNENHAVTRMAASIHEYGDQFQHRDFKTIQLAKKEIVKFRDNLTTLIGEF